MCISVEAAVFVLCSVSRMGARVMCFFCVSVGHILESVVFQCTADWTSRARSFIRLYVSRTYRSASGRRRRRIMLRFSM